VQQNHPKTGIDRPKTFAHSTKTKTPFFVEYFFGISFLATFQ
jgi:hypothetical protein